MIAVKMLGSLLCLALLLVGLERSSGARLLFGAPQNPSSFDTKLESVVAAATAAAVKDVAENHGLACEGAEMKPWSGSAQNATGGDDDNNLTFRFNKDRTRDVANKEAEVAYNVLPKGGVPPSGPSPGGNAAVDGQRLSRSIHSPPVGHMQIALRKKRVLKSTPSPGNGH